MKRLLSAILAATLALGATAGAADAAPRYGHGYGNGYGYSRGHRRNGDAAALGFGLFALGALAIIASQNNARDRGYDDEYYAPPPPPPRGYNGYSPDYPRPYRD